MFTRTLDDSKLDILIDSCIREMQESYIESSEEYAQIMDQLVKLYKIKSESRLPRVSPDTLALIGGNLLGILMILRYERIDIITSKATNFILKPR